MRPLRTTRRGASAAPAADLTWVELSLTVAAGAAEAASAILQDLRIGGLVEERTAPSRVRLRVYLPASRVRPTTLRSLRTRIEGLARYGLHPGRVHVSRRLVASRRWATAWRAHVRPVRVGRVLVRPSWIPAPRRHRHMIEIRIDPGMAFGTGMHPSTRLCLSALQDILQGPRHPRPTVFDVGTGSGILAIAASRLGADHVWAVDNDPVAVTAARVNVRLNAASGRVRVTQGTGLDRAPGRAHLIVANLIAETIIPLLPRIARHLTPGGVFVGSGIIADRLAAVLRAAREAGLGHVRLLAEGEWRAAILVGEAHRRPGSRHGCVSSRTVRGAIGRYFGQ